MTITEAVRLLRKVKAYKPQQEMDEFTAEAWHEALGEYNWADADRAVVELAGESTWIDLDDVKKRIRHYRAERIEHGFADLLPPSGLTPVEYTAWSRGVRKRLASGETALAINGGMTFAQLPEHDIRQLLGNPR